MRLYDGIAFGIERHGANGRPVSSVARPARRVECARPEVQVMSGRQNRLIFPGVALSGADVTNAAVAMIDVVPMDEASGPGTGLVEIGKALGGKLGAVLGGTKQRLGIGVVVADARPGVGGLDAPPRQNSCRPDMIWNLGAIRTKDGTVRRSIQEQSGGAVVAAGERRCRCIGERNWGVGADIGTLAGGCAVQAPPRGGRGGARATGGG